MTQILHEEFETLGAGQNFCCSQTLTVQLHGRECFLRNCKSLWIFHSFYVRCTMVTLITQIPTMHQTSPVTTLHSPIKALFQYFLPCTRTSRKRPQFDGFQNISFSYLLTPCNIVFLEKLNGSQQVKKFPAFYGSLPCLQKPTTCPYPEPDQSNP